ncbi:MAG: hypothetical protein IJD53_04460 [Alistipes sp.]|nr:hypothetical protein [Alistipes sp.]
MKKFYLVTAVAVVLSLLVAGFVIRDLRSEKRRLGRNVEALLSTAEFYRTRAGESAASVAALHLEIDELKAYRSRDAEQIRSLGIRLRRAESIAHSALESGYEVSLRLRDTIVVRDTLRDTIRLFLHDDRWSHLQGIIFGDSLRYELRTVDTLTQIVHRVPRRFLFFKFGTKAIRQEIVSSNPHSHIVYSEYIELGRRNKR